MQYLIIIWQKNSIIISAKIYKELSELKNDDLSDKDNECINKAEEELEKMLFDAANKVNAPHLSLADRTVLSI